MAVCPKCNTNYDDEKHYCRDCGSFLLTETKYPPCGNEMESTNKDKKKLICLKCQILYEVGNYCRKCGSLLVQRTELNEKDDPPLERRIIKRWSKQWLRFFEEKKNLEVCLTKLEAHRERISSDLFTPMFTRYRDQVESISSLHEEIERRLESVRKRATDEIELQEKELTPVQKRLEEIEFLYRSGAMTQEDFSRKKRVSRDEIRSRERCLRKCRQIITVLPGKMGGEMASPRRARDLLRPFPLIAVSGMILLLVVGGYFTWKKPSSSSGPISDEIVQASPHSSSQKTTSPGAETREADGIRSLFENIRQANLKKNISLFMSCYARDFEDKKGKRLATLETWESLNYLDLSYHFKNQTIADNTADVRVEWHIRTSPKVGGQPQDTRTVLDVILSREEGSWKIKEIKSGG